jgi:hypothetical protein
MTARAATIVAAGAGAAALAARVAKGMATARSIEEGGLRAALARQRRLGIEAVIVIGLLALGAFLVYHFVVKTIKNTRPLGGANVVVTRGHIANENEASFTVDAAHPATIVGAANDLTSYASVNDGRTWTRAVPPRLPIGSCALHAPRMAVLGTTQVVAFLASKPCGDDITPYLVVSTRDGITGKWTEARRVLPSAWQYGFDDAPAIAVDPERKIVYLAWSRGLTEHTEGTVVSRSEDGGRTWSTPVVVAPAANDPHLPTIAVAANGDVYAGGIDNRHGIWIARSTDHGLTFSAPSQVGRLRANPSATCSVAAQQPLPKEEKSCSGPNPTLLATSAGPLVIYDDVGVNGTRDVVVAGAAFATTVSPPDKGKTQQFLPAAALDAQTGVLWACWYDTTFDPNAHRAWFTCSASHDGRTWTPPERAAAAPTDVNDLFTDLAGANGFYPSVAAGSGRAHPVWIGVNPTSFQQELVTATLSERDAFSLKP